MIDFEQARALVAQGCPALPGERVPIGDALGRVCAEDVAARVSSPPADLSAMDGFAVREADAQEGNSLAIVGESRAGNPFAGTIASGEAVAVSTGAHIPSGAERVVIVEDVRCEGRMLQIAVAQPGGTNIRPAGMDFTKGEVLVRRGERLTRARLGIAACGGHAWIAAYGRPRVAIATNGDELIDPGSEPAATSIYDSNSVALRAQFAQFGAEADWIGRAGDSRDSVREMLDRGDGADLLVVAGGASVGPHDLVKPVFEELGGTLTFSKVALRPGKPVWFGSLPSGTRVLGLPGNAVSAYVTALLFGRLAVDCLSGVSAPRSLDDALRPALSAEALPANGPRDAFERATLEYRDDGTTRIAPAPSQDSSLLRPLAAADALLFRKANAPAVAAGAPVSYLPIG